MKDTEFTNWVVALLFLCTTSSTSLAAENEDRSKSVEIPVAITSQGGTSLGAYEAGLQWAIMELLRSRRPNSTSPENSKNPDEIGLDNIQTAVVASAGASAGNVNTFLGLFNYCRVDRPSGAKKENGHGQEDLMPNGASYSNNWFWNTWIPMGIDQLFPSYRLSWNFTQKGREKELKKTYCADLDSEEREICQDPGDRFEVYSDDDALLSRNAYDRMMRYLERMVDSGDDSYQLDSRCLYPIGVTLTQTSPETLEWDHSKKRKMRNVRDDEIKMPVGRAVVALQPDCRQAEQERNKDYCAIKFSNYFGESKDENERDRRQRLGWSLELPQSMRKYPHLDFKTLRTVIEAGSAFPFAFGPKQLDTCYPDGERPLEQGYRCRHLPYSVKRRYFYDGGMFDNLPVGLVYELIGSELERNTKNTDVADSDSETESDTISKRIHVIALDVTRSRYEPRYKGRPAPPERGILGILKTLSSVIPIAREYELQALSRYYPHARDRAKNSSDATTEMSAYPSSRFFPVVGESLATFGAFLGQPFREYDYHMGVYDAVHYMAKAICVGFSDRKVIGQTEDGPVESPADDAWKTRLNAQWKTKGLKEQQRCVKAVFQDAYTKLFHQVTFRNFDEKAGAVAVLTALRTETQKTGRFVVPGIKYEDITSGLDVPDELSVDNLGKGLMPKDCNPLPDDDEQKKQDEKGKKRSSAKEDGQSQEDTASENKIEETHRMAIFKNILKSAQCIAVYGASEHPDAKSFWLANALGPEFLYIVANLRKVKDDILALRKKYTSWRDEYLDNDNEKLDKRPAFIEQGLVDKSRHFPGVVDDPEGWTRTFLQQLLDRLIVLNADNQYSEMLIDLIQFVLEFKDRQEATGIQMGPSLTPWKHAADTRGWVVAAHALLPSFVGTGVYLYHNKPWSFGATFELWRMQFSGDKGKVAFYVTPQIMLQASKYQRVLFGGTLSPGFRLPYVGVSELEPFLGVSYVHVYGDDPYPSAKPLAVQAGVSAYLIAGTLRLSTGAQIFGTDWTTGAWGGYLGLGVTDIPGLIYWLLRIGL